MGTYILENEEALKKVLENMLRKGMVEGVMVQTAGESGVFTSIITDPDFISKTAPLAPLFSNNNAVFLQNNGTRNIAVVVKPCEARAINELKKLNQINTDKLVVICADCQGTINPRDGLITEPLTEAKKKELEKDSIPIRKACTVCEHFTPPEVDISIMAIGTTGGYILATDREELLDGLELKAGEIPSGRNAEVEKIRKENLEKKEKMVEELDKKLGSPDTLVEFFKDCIRCDNCRDMCPICYCKQCYFETPLGDLRTDEMLHQAATKGILRIPPDILFYQLTRNIHVAAGCVECGACEEVCPRDIPLLDVWKSITGNVQGLFEYVSGMKRDEPLPLVGFKESELEEVK